MKEQTAEMNDKGRSKDPQEGHSQGQEQETGVSTSVDWQGLTPAEEVHTNEAPREAWREMGEKVIANPDSSEYGRNTENRTPMPEEAKVRLSRNEGTEPERGVDIDRDPRPDARDERKVERLAAPDWRSEQPLPSARNALDPRGKNTPAELFETEEEREQERKEKR